MSKNIARDFERLRVWRRLIVDSAGIEDLELKVFAAGGISAFPLSKRVIRYLMNEIYGKSACWSEDTYALARSTFCEIIRKTDWFDAFSEYISYLCSRYLQSDDINSSGILAPGAEFSIKELSDAIYDRLNHKKEQIPNQWAEDVVPICLPESAIDMF